MINDDAESLIRVLLAYYEKISSSC